MSRVHDYDLVLAPQANDEFYVSSPSGNTYIDKKTTRQDLFANVATQSTFNANVAIAADVDVTGNSFFSTANVTIEALTNLRHLKVGNTVLTIAGNTTPANSGVVIGEQGSIAWDGNFLYVQISNTVVKRATLSTF